MTDRCVGCNKVMARSKKAPWASRHQGNGMCSSCYERNRGRIRSTTAAPIDEMAVLRALRGELPGRLRPVEVAAVVAEGTHRGYSAAELATRLNVTVRTVTRHRARLRAAA